MRVTHFHKIIDLIILAALVVFATFVTVFVPINFLTSALLFFGLPSTYLIYRKPSNFKKACIAGVLFGLVWGFAFDFLAEYNGAWDWSARNTLVFPGHILGVVSFDIMIWFFLWIFLVVAFYEYFIEYDFDGKISTRVALSLKSGIIINVVIVLLYIFYPSALKIQYAYFVLAVLALAPFAYVIIKKPKLWIKLSAVLPFFIFLYLFYEISALSAGLWHFPGSYIGSVEIGSIRFPLEEFVFWILASSAAVVANHELYIDDLR